MCANTPLYLNANTPALNETGTWSVSPSTGITFNDINSPNAIVNGLGVNKTYTFIWKIENACNSNKDTLIVTTNNITGPIQANAGSDQCKVSGTISVTLSGNNPTNGTGTWTKISGNSATITNSNLYNTTVTGLTDGTYQFEWSILSNGACNPTRDTVMITISATTSLANAGSDQQICGNSAILSGNTPSIGTGYWSQLSGNADAQIENLNSATTNITGLSNGVYNFVWTINNNACPSKTDTVTLFVTNPPTIPNVGTDIIVCGYDTVSLNGNTISVGKGIWSFVSGPNTPVFANSILPNTKVTGMISGTYVFRWSSYNGPFCPTVNDDVSVTVVLPANAGADQNYCDFVSTVNLNGTLASTGTWNQLSGPGIASITATSTNTAIASNLIAGTYAFEYSIASAGCNYKDTMLVNIYNPPTQPDAGIDYSYCSKDTIQLNGNIPFIGTGTWSKLSGPTGGSFKPNANTPGTKFYTASAGTYVFVWKISNYTCSKSDQVIIKNYLLPTNANAGSDQLSVCSGSITMNANLPSTGMGSWSLIDGPNTPEIVSSVLPGTTVNNLIPGTYSFEWNISSGVCPVKKDTVEIIVNQAPTTADAGNDQTLCNVVSTYLQGNNPSTGTGTWLQYSGPNSAIFSDVNNPNTQISNLVDGTYVFHWTISLASCSSTDEVVIKVYQNPTTAFAGNDIENCLFTSLTLNGNAPVFGNGLWTQLSGPVNVNILNPNLPVTNILGTVAGNYSFIWEISNGLCGTSSDTVNVVVSDIPSIAVAGADQILCNTNTFNLNAEVRVNGFGKWYQTSGNTVAYDSTSATASVTNVIPGTYTFKWKTTENFCISEDTVKIVVNAATYANAGSNQQHCNATIFYLNANTPAEGNGTWSKVSGPAAVITDINSPITTITGATNGTYVFKWTVTNGNCTPSSSEVTVVNYENPTIADAGANQNICSDTLSLNANYPTVGVGLWSQVNGPNNAVFENANSNNTKVYSLIQGTYVFRWTIANGICNSYSEVTINVSSIPTTAFAGNSQELCNENTVNLIGNLPNIGNGVWSFVSGPNSPTISNPSANQTLVTDLINGIYTFKWSIFNGYCPSSESLVNITNYQAPNIADAGVTQNLCNATSTNLTGNLPLNGNGMWTLLSGPNTPSIANLSLFNTSISGLINGTYIYIWTINNGNCPASSDTLVINNYLQINQAEAGNNQNICGNSVTMNANLPTIGTLGTWEQTAGPNMALISDINSNTAVISGLIPGTYTFNWTITNGNCTPSTDSVKIYVFSNIDSVFAGNNQSFCYTNTFTTLAANTPSNGIGNWSQISGPNNAVIANALSPITSVTNLIIGTYTFRWTITNGNCISYDDVEINLYKCTDLSLDKKLTDPNPLVNDNIYKNDTVTFTITVKNNNTDFSATNISVIDTLPEGLNYISYIATTGTYNHISGIWNIPLINASDSAKLLIKVSVDTSAENNACIIGFDDIDENPMNNCSFASVSITSSSSGGNGGLESNGNLASKVALRNFIRHKEHRFNFDEPSKLELFTQESILAVKNKSSQSTEIIDFIPMTGPSGVPALITTPTDLIGISNAIDVVSVDYFDTMKRKAAILGIASNPGTVYEHTKMVCDRLDGGYLKSINYVYIKNHPFIITGIVQDNGNTDYAVSFIAYKSGNNYTIDNQWDLEEYHPLDNHAVMNYQVWAINEQQTIELVTKLIDQMIAKGYNINFKNSSFPKTPEVYVQNGYYKDGNLELNIVNKKGASTVQINGNKAFVEDGIRYPFDYSTNISNSYNSILTVPTGNVFDIGFYMSSDVSISKDVLYFADGPWGREFDETGATITDFSISTQFNSPQSGAFNMARNANIEGSVKTYASLFRVLRVGNKPVDLTAYNNLEFTAFGSGSFEVVISKAGITAWNEQYRTTINLNNSNPVTYQLPFSQFANESGQHNLNPKDVVSIVFIKKGNNSTYQNFVLNVKDMRFINSTPVIENSVSTLDEFSVSPNPCSNSTNIAFEIDRDQNVNIQLYSINGDFVKNIENKKFSKGYNNQIVNVEGLKSGIYLIKIESLNKTAIQKVVVY